MTDIVVTEKDREAANLLWQSIRDLGPVIDAVEVGQEIGLGFLRAFARHRIEARREALEDAAQVCDAGIANADDWDGSYWDQACFNLAQAIRDLR